MSIPADAVFVGSEAGRLRLTAIAEGLFVSGQGEKGGEAGVPPEGLFGPI